ncbi:hypothetical protein ACH33_18085 [Aneurinibacillus sp. XH2]|nr:hypothetical protein ACH33_18085 [Aneurinibacillus sp. XH2]
MKIDTQARKLANKVKNVFRAPQKCLKSTLKLTFTFMGYLPRTQTSVTVQFSRNFFFIFTAFQRRLFYFITTKIPCQQLF